MLSVRQTNVLQRDRSTGLSIAAVVLSTLWVAVPLLHGWGVYLSTVGFFGEPIVWLGYLTVSIGALGWFVVGLFFGTLRRVVPLLIVGVALVLQQTVDLEKTATRWNFRHRFAIREEVVRLIERGELVATRDAIAMSRAADLPGRFRALSAGGYVLIARHAEGFSVTFYVKRVGMFDDDNYTAFVYRSGPGQPTTEVEDTDRFYHVEALQPHWLFVKHT
jgi:hypothetical protein